jgi:hypothetical protein
MIREETNIWIVRPNADIEDELLPSPRLPKSYHNSEQCIRQVHLKSYLHLGVFLCHVQFLEAAAWSGAFLFHVTRMKASLHLAAQSWLIIALGRR